MMSGEDNRDETRETAQAYAWLILRAAQGMSSRASAEMRQRCTERARLLTEWCEQDGVDGLVAELMAEHTAFTVEVEASRASTSGDERASQIWDAVSSGALDDAIDDAIAEPADDDEAGAS